ncbi:MULTISPECIES: hypothetical protein [Vagococcus]|uniref:Uncharacterized protein n=1 Tax=Vagococcus teuberi TaxID=519472 RepID=A0A1J0A7E9_9ENTE|nr:MULTISPECIES: hypothetical protein [Vagococcus]APB31841.1 hypothetical protein BHY08_08435 [Vagococcus teuberi]RHH69968.1 hypothetical protein DW196_04145 [Vagococcus sp. AM17-17]
MRKKDGLEYFLQNKLNARGKLIVILFLFYLWLRYSTNLYVMLKFFVVVALISLVVLIYELIFYKKIYKE